MAFTDLEEHLAEVFGERIAEHFPSRIGITDRARRSPEGYACQNAAKCAKRKAKREAKRLAELMDGTRPSRCDGPGCFNLLNPKPRNGIPFLYCGIACEGARGRRRRATCAGGIPAPERRRSHVAK